MVLLSSNEPGAPLARQQLPEYSFKTLVDNLHVWHCWVTIVVAPRKYRVHATRPSPQISQPLLGKRCHISMAHDTGTVARVVRMEKPVLKLAEEQRENEKWVYIDAPLAYEHWQTHFSLS